MPVSVDARRFFLVAGAISVVSAMLSSGIAQADQPNAKTTPRQARANDPFAPPEIDPELPNVLLIGDSISIGYMLSAREALAGDANVFRPPVNCGPTTRGIEKIDQWIGDRKWDVIHFNFGLHDLKFMGPDGKNLADPAAADSKRQVSIEDYSENLRVITKKLKATGAGIIWRETTPVPEGAKGRLPADAPVYNAAAAKVMEELGGISTDPMFAYATEHAAMQKKADVHYTPAGSKQLGQHVAEVVRAVICARGTQ